MKTNSEVEEFERVEEQLRAMLAEIGELSKKKANDGINKFKLKLINTLLDKLNKILGAEKPFKDFEKFDENDLPTNSDVVVMLSQYAAALFLMRQKNTTYHEYNCYWMVNGQRSNMKTKDPEHFKYGGK